MEGREQLGHILDGVGTALVATGDLIKTVPDPDVQAAGTMMGALGAGFAGQSAALGVGGPTFTAGDLGNMLGTAAGLYFGPVTASTLLILGAEAGLITLTTPVIIPIVFTAGVGFAAGYLLSEGGRFLGNKVGEHFGNPQICPLVLDLDGDGLDLTSLPSSSTFFDLDADGFKEVTAWVGPSDGLLVWDRNADGFINDSSELFGGTATSGFTVLGGLDTNTDGKISSSDTNFADLRIWVDDNQDGLAEAGELSTLSALNISELSLTTSHVGSTVAGNSVESSASVTRTVGGSLTMYDVKLAVDQIHTAYIQTAIPVYDPEVWLLPELHGYGTAPSLRFAMMTNSTLKGMVQDLVDNRGTYANFSELRADVSDVVLTWLGMDAVDPESRGVMVDARHLGALETLMGEPYGAVGSEPRPGVGTTLEDAWGHLLDTLTLRFAVQLTNHDITAGFLAELAVIAGEYQADDTLTEGYLYDRTTDAIALFDETPTLTDFQAAFTALHFYTDGDVVSDADAPTEGQSLFVDGLYNTILSASATDTSDGAYGDRMADFRAMAYAFVNSTTELDAAVLDRAEALFGDINALSAPTIISGTNSSANLTGTGGADWLFGHQGDETLSGGEGNDHYFYSEGDGDDIINETQNLAGTADTLAFGPTLVSDDVVLSVSGNWNVTFSFTGKSGSATVWDAMETNNKGIELYAFGDGVVWTQADVRTAFITQSQTSGNDTIYGFQADDTFTAGTGNDAIYGFGGDDIYNYARGDGNDTIHEDQGLFQGTGDTLLLHSINPSDVTLGRSGNDAILTIKESSPGAGNGGVVTLTQEYDDYYQMGVETIVFDNSTVWSRSDLRIALLAASSTSGNDTIYGFNVHDTITGGAGNDDLYGYAADDTYNYTRGDGNDTIHEDQGLFDGASDTLLIHSANSGDVALSRSGNSAILTVKESSPGAGNGGTITLLQQFDDYYQMGVETIVFDNSTVWTRSDLRLAFLASSSTSGNDTIYGFNVNDTITGGAGNDSLSGYDADDTYVYAHGDGNDIIYEDNGLFGGAQDTLTLTGINPGDVSLSRSGNDAILTVKESSLGAGDGGTITLSNQYDDFYQQGIEKVVFANSTVWSDGDIRIQMLAGASTSSADTIDGFNTDDVITGGGGADTLRGFDGADVFTYVGVSDSTVAFADTILDFHAGADKIDVSGIDADSITSGNQAFSFVGSSAFSSTAGELRASASGSDTLVEADVDGNGTADFAVVLTGSISLSSSDFIL